jgi:hypothetical protein
MHEWYEYVQMLPDSPFAVTHLALPLRELHALATTDI